MTGGNNSVRPYNFSGTPDGVSDAFRFNQRVMLWNVSTPAPSAPAVLVCTHRGRGFVGCSSEVGFFERGTGCALRRVSFEAQRIGGGRVRAPFHTLTGGGHQLNCFRLRRRLAKPPMPDPTPIFFQFMYAVDYRDYSKAKRYAGLA